MWYPLNEDIELDKGETMFNKGIDIYMTTLIIFAVRISEKEVT